MVPVLSNLCGYGEISYVIILMCQNFVVDMNSGFYGFIKKNLKINSVWRRLVKEVWGEDGDGLR